MTTRQQRWILCGGVASGKSLVCSHLEQNGIATIDADSFGHTVIEPGGLAFDEVAGAFPDAVREGRIDRVTLAGIVFADHNALGKLEAITHPHIFGMIRGQVEDLDEPVVVEMPVLKELGAGWQRMVVDVDEAAQVHRAVERGMTVADAKARLASQPTRREWLAAADLVIPNHGNFADLESIVDRLVAAIA